MSVHMYVHRMISILLLTHVRTQDNLYSSSYKQRAPTNTNKTKNLEREGGKEIEYFIQLYTQKKIRN